MVLGNRRQQEGPGQLESFEKRNAPTKCPLPFRCTSFCVAVLLLSAGLWGKTVFILFVSQLFSPSFCISKNIY